MWPWRRRTRGASTAPSPHGIAGEGVLHLETADGTLTHRDHRTPAGYTSWSRRPVRWTVALTRHRFLVRSDAGPMVDVPWTDSRVQGLRVAREHDLLLVAADTALFRLDATGTVEVRVRCADPDVVVALVEDLRHTFRTP